MTRVVEPCFAQGQVLPDGYSGVMFDACLPFGHCFTSKLTFWFFLQRF